MATISESELAEGRAEYDAIQETPETLADPKLEAVASILQVWLNMEDERTIRYEVLLAPESSLDTLIEARRVTCAHKRAAALRKIVKTLPDTTQNCFCSRCVSTRTAKNALAAYERIADEPRI